MEVAEIVAQFERLKGKFEQEAVDAAISRRGEVTPELLRILEEIADPEGARHRVSENDYIAHFYAMYLLAQFRETRAHPLILKIGQFPSDLLDGLLGDFVTEDFGNALASTCGGNISGIQSLIENPAADQWARGAALGSLATLVAAGVKSRDEIVGYFGELFRGKLTDKNDIVWSDLVIYSTDLCATELLGDIEQAYANGLVDSEIISLRDVNKDFSKGLAWALTRLASAPHRKLIDDTAKEFGSWPCFHKDEEEDRARRMDALSQPYNPEWDENRVPYKRDTPKIGRNEPCPCGSGKKYKKCCGS